MRTCTTQEQRGAPGNELNWAKHDSNLLLVIRKIGFLETDELGIKWLFSWNDGKQKAVYYCVFTCSWASVSPSRLCNPASLLWALLNYQQLKIWTTNLLLLFLFVCLQICFMFSLESRIIDMRPRLCSKKKAVGSQSLRTCDIHSTQDMILQQTLLKNSRLEGKSEVPIPPPPRFSPIGNC